MPRKRPKRKKWTPEEVKRLIYLSEHYTKGDIARIMKRSPSSINNKRRELGIESFTSSTDKWNFSQISEAVGVSKGVVNRTWVKHGLKFVQRGYMKLVDETDLLRFMKEHPTFWDATKCDYYLFYQYPWFIRKLEQDKKIPFEQRRHRWTDYEKQQLMALSRKGYTHQQIADAIGKTKRAVDHMSCKIWRERCGA